uniref:lymphotoxin-alpha-like n=1 Tax=Semicossyphus pulcher TaxID=241346 RepID=UPI0037E98C13
MEAMDGSRLLMRVNQTSDMEEDYRENTSVQLLRREKVRLQWMSKFLAVAVLLLVIAVLALLAGLVLGGRGHPSPDSKPTMQRYSHLSGVSAEQQKQDSNSPSAMLTAPGRISHGEYLEWESEVGNAYCHGFNYSSGNLVVPRGGIYRVFLQITFENKTGACSPGGQIRLSNIVYVFRENYQKSVSLLSSVDTVMCSVEQWSKSLYTAGLFSLDANCRLSVKSSHPGLITQTEQLVFFGAELLHQ